MSNNRSLSQNDGVTFRSWLEAAAHVCERDGAAEICAVVEAASNLKSVTASRYNLGLKLYRLAAARESGWNVVSRPKYRLGAVEQTEGLHHFPVQSRAVKILSLAGGEYCDTARLSELARKIRLQYAGKPWAFDEFSTYRALTDPRFSRMFVTQGALTIGHTAAANAPKVIVRNAIAPTEEPKFQQNIHEAHLEQLIAEDLDQIEPGLTLVGRQYQAPPVGRIDLLCKDRKGALVVIEIKKLNVSTSSIIDQITRYLGWVKHHVASPGQNVRGILITGRPDEKLRYSLAALPEVRLLSIDISLKAETFDRER